jgi:hypothetical protein
MNIYGTKYVAIQFMKLSYTLSNSKNHMRNFLAFILIACCLGSCESEPGTDREHSTGDTTHADSRLYYRTDITDENRILRYQYDSVHPGVKDTAYLIRPDTSKLHQADSARQQHGIHTDTVTGNPADHH